MKKMILSLISLFILIGFNSSFNDASADEIEYNCEGSYESKVPYNYYDSSSVSVHAHLTATILGDEDGQGNFTLEKARLTLKATNHGGEDAGSFVIRKELKGKADRTSNPLYKNLIKFDLGSKVGAAYVDDGDTPDTYILLPLDDSNTVYVQRQNSGHDQYPTIALKCR